jgi:hypothetical protein
MSGSTLGRILLGVGLLLVAGGAFLAIGGRLPFGSLPGDITVSHGGVSVTFLIGTSIVLSVVLSVVLAVVLNVVVRR